MLKQLISALLVAACFISCSNDNDPDDNLPGDRLVRVTDLEDPLDSTYYDRFEYDNSGRVTKIFGGGTDDLIATFYYNGTDNKPYKMDGEEGESVTHFFQYNSNGQLMQDSSFNYVDLNCSITDYSYYPGLVIRDEGYRPTAGAAKVIIGKDSMYVDASGKITQERQYTDHFIIGGPLKLYEIKTFAYDNRISPLGKLNVGFLKRYDEYGPMETIHSFQHFQVNNCTRVDITYYDLAGTAAGTDFETYANSYYSNNYLKEYLYQGDGYMGKVFYTYQ